MCQILKLKLFIFEISKAPIGKPFCCWLGSYWRLLLHFVTTEDLQGNTVFDSYNKEALIALHIY